MKGVVMKMMNDEGMNSMFRVQYDNGEELLFRVIYDFIKGDLWVEQEITKDDL